MQSIGSKFISKHLIASGDTLPTIMPMSYMASRDELSTRFWASPNHYRCWKISFFVVWNHIFIKKIFFILNSFIILKLPLKILFFFFLVFSPSIYFLLCFIVFLKPHLKLAIFVMLEIRFLILSLISISS